MINEIMQRIELPIYTYEGMIACINDCLKADKKGKKGLNLEHRNIILSNYRPSKDSNPITEEDEKKFMCEIIRYLAKSLYFEFSSLKNGTINNEELIVNIKPNFILKNPGLKNLKVKDLLKIANMNDEEMLKHRTRNITSIDLFIEAAYVSLNLWDGDTHKFHEHVCAEPIYEYTEPNSQDIGINSLGVTRYSKRIYMNGSNGKKQLNFIFELLKKCIDRRIPCDMKPCFNSVGIDGTIYYSSNENFESLLISIEEVIDEHPELLECFGSPIISGANVRAKDGNCYYAIGHGGSDFRKIPGLPMAATYNDVVDSIINITYTIACLKLIKYYWARVCKEGSNISEFKNLSIDSLDSIIIIRTHQQEIRSLALKIINSNHESYQKLVQYYCENLRIVTSLINFGDLDHCDVPMYKDESFLQFEDLVINQKKVK